MASPQKAFAVEDSESDEDRFEQNFVDKDSKGQMSMFVDNYGESRDIPSYNVLDAKVWPYQSDYFLQVVRYQFPDKIKLRTFNVGEEQPVLRSIEEDFPDEEYDVARLKLIKIQDNVLTEVLETTLPVEGAKKAKIQFSKDGRYLALLVKDVTLQIYEVNRDESGLEDLIRQIKEREEYQKQYHEEKEGEEGVVFQQFRGKVISGQKRMIFANHSRVLSTIGKTSLNLIPLMKGGDHVESYEIFKEKFAKILDVNCVTTQDFLDQDDPGFLDHFQKTFKCEIACKSKQENCIEILEISQAHADKGRHVIKGVENNDKKIFYLKETPDMAVLISENFEKVILVNQDENYILERQKTEAVTDAVDPDGDSEEDEAVEQDSDGGEEEEVDVKKWHQNSLTWLKGKRVRMMSKKGKNFMLVVCQDYDNEISIMSSRKKEGWTLPIKRGIEPGSLKMFDIHLEDIQKPSRMARRFMILSQRDEELFIDITNNEEKTIVGRHMFSKYRSFCPYWPFFGFQGLESGKNYFWLIDVNEPRIDGEKVINRIEIPNPEGVDPSEGIKVIHLSQAFITETKNLFIVCNSADYYLIFQVSLDDGFEKGEYIKERALKAEFVWKYPKSDVGTDASLLDIHVRDSSEKDNQKLMMFFLHEGCIYYYTKGEPKLEKMFPTLQKKIFKISDNAFAVRQDDQLDDLENEDDIKLLKKFNLVQVNIEFGQYSTEKIYQEKLKSKEQIEGFGYDYKQNRLLILYQTKKRSSIKLLDTENNQQIWKQSVKNEELIGRIKSNLFILLDGHLYFDKHIIKIRFDLLNENNDRDFTEDEVFDMYENVLNLKQKQEFKETVKTGMPITMKEFHKLVYIIKNDQVDQANQLLILPYLHERKIYLSRQDQGDEYFYNSIVSDPEQQKQARMNNQASQIARGSVTSTTKVRKQTLFISMNLTKYLVYVFQANGLCQKKINFSELVKQYGKPKSVSPSGTVFIFQNSKKQDYKINIMELDINKGTFEMRETFDPINMIQQYLERLLQDGDQAKREFAERIKEKYQDHLDPTYKKNSFSYNINDDYDITLKITRDKAQMKKFREELIEKEEQRDLKQTEDARTEFRRAQKETKKQLIFIYNSPEEQILFAPIEGTASPQYDTRTQELFANGADGYTISNKYAFFWNAYSVWYLELNDIPKISDPSSVQRSCEELGLFIDPKEKQTKVKKVRNGSADEIIALIVEQSPTSDCIIIWNLREKREEEAFDMGKDPKVFWDANGDPYLTEGNKVVIGKQGVRLTCYDVDKINAIDQSKAKKFGWNVGHRFDSEHHSWAYLRDYVSLSFCYMTFVIKNKFDQDNEYAKEDYLFDREQYNYIINKRTAFTDTEENVADHDKLAFILRQFESIDAAMLEQLQYKTTESSSEYSDLLKPEDANGQLDEEQVPSSTALHLAYNQKNARSIKIILTYLAKLQNTSSDAYSDIMPNLIEYNGFADYLWGLTFTTTQMENKQALRVRSPYSSTIVSLAKSKISYIDNHYFMAEMKEDSYIYDRNLDENGELRAGRDAGPSDAYVSYPVRVEGLEVEWILGEQGRRFLAAVLNSQNLDLYDIPWIQIVIEYLYTMQKDKIKWTIVPLYTVQVILFYTMSALNEAQYEGTKIEADEGKAVVEGEEAAAVRMTLVRKGGYPEAVVYTFCATNFIINIMVIYYRLSKQRTVLRGMIADWAHALVELATIILNLSTTIMIIMESAGYQQGMEYTRIIQAWVSILIWDRPTQYLQLADSVAPYILIFKTTLWHIRYFIPTLLIILFAFSNSFWLLGKNQRQFDNIPEGEEPLYSQSVAASLKYMYLLALGELSADAFDYEKGEASELYWLWALFIIASFIVIIQLLNLLIALMGEPFAENSDVEQAKNSQEHLRFVMDHWQITEEGRKGIKYLITAFLNEEEEEDVELLEDIQEELTEMKASSKKGHQDMMREIEKIRQQVEKVITKMEEDADNEGDNQDGPQ